MSSVRSSTPFRRRKEKREAEAAAAGAGAGAEEEQRATATAMQQMQQQAAALPYGAIAHSRSNSVTRSTSGGAMVTPHAIVAAAAPAAVPTSSAAPSRSHSRSQSRTLSNPPTPKTLQRLQQAALQQLADAHASLTALSSSLASGEGAGSTTTTQHDDDDPNESFDAPIAHHSAAVAANATAGTHPPSPATSAAAAAAAAAVAAVASLPPAASSSGETGDTQNLTSIVHAQSRLIATLLRDKKTLLEENGRHRRAGKELEGRVERILQVQRRQARRGGAGAGAEDSSADTAAQTSDTDRTNTTTDAAVAAAADATGSNGPTDPPLSYPPDRVVELVEHNVRLVQEVQSLASIMAHFLMQAGQACEMVRPMLSSAPANLALDLHAVHALLRQVSAELIEAYEEQSPDQGEFGDERHHRNGPSSTEDPTGSSTATTAAPAPAPWRRDRETPLPVPIQTVIAHYMSVPAVRDIYATNVAAAAENAASVRGAGAGATFSSPAAVAGTGFSSPPLLSPAGSPAGSPRSPFYAPARSVLLSPHTQAGLAGQGALSPPLLGLGSPLAAKLPPAAISASSFASVEAAQHSGAMESEQRRLQDRLAALEAENASLRHAAAAATAAAIHSADQQQQPEQPAAGAGVSSSASAGRDSADDDPGREESLRAALQAAEAKRQASNALAHRLAAEKSQVAGERRALQAEVARLAAALQSEREAHRMELAVHQSERAKIARKALAVSRDRDQRGVLATATATKPKSAWAQAVEQSHAARRRNGSSLSGSATERVRQSSAGGDSNASGRGASTARELDRDDESLAEQAEADADAESREYHSSAPPPHGNGAHHRGENERSRSASPVRLPPQPQPHPQAHPSSSSSMAMTVLSPRAQAQAHLGDVSLYREEDLFEGGQGQMRPHASDDEMEGDEAAQTMQQYFESQMPPLAPQGQQQQSQASQGFQSSFLNGGGGGGGSTGGKTRPSPAAKQSGPTSRTGSRRPSVPSSSAAAAAAAAAAGSVMASPPPAPASSHAHAHPQHPTPSTSDLFATPLQAHYSASMGSDAESVNSSPMFRPTSSAGAASAPAHASASTALSLTSTQLAVTMSRHGGGSSASASTALVVRVPGRVRVGATSATSAALQRSPSPSPSPLAHRLKRSPPAASPSASIEARNASSAYRMSGSPPVAPLNPSFHEAAALPPSAHRAVSTPHTSALPHTHQSRYVLVDASKRTGFMHHRSGMGAPAAVQARAQALVGMQSRNDNPYADAQTARPLLTSPSVAYEPRGHGSTPTRVAAPQLHFDSRPLSGSSLHTQTTVLTHRHNFPSSSTRPLARQNSSIALRVSQAQRDERWFVLGGSDGAQGFRDLPPRIDSRWSEEEQRAHAARAQQIHAEQFAIKQAQQPALLLPSPDATVAPLALTEGERDGDAAAPALLAAWADHDALHSDGAEAEQQLDATHLRLIADGAAAAHGGDFYDDDDHGVDQRHEEDEYVHAA